MNAEFKSTPLPLQDIVGPMEIHEVAGLHWEWMLVGGVLFLGVLLGVLWRVYFKKITPLSVKDRALVQLQKLAGQITLMEPYPFSIEVSDVLRAYLRDTYCLSATTQTSPEFLKSIRDLQVFDQEMQNHLADFLAKADLIKFARLQASGEDCRGLLELAQVAVRGVPSEALVPQGMENSLQKPRVS